MSITIDENLFQQKIDQIERDITVRVDGKLNILAEKLECAKKKREEQDEKIEHLVRVMGELKYKNKKLKCDTLKLKRETEKVQTINQKLQDIFLAYNMIFAKMKVMELDIPKEIEQDFENTKQQLMEIQKYIKDG